MTKGNSHDDVRSDSKPGEIVFRKRGRSWPRRLLEALIEARGNQARAYLRSHGHLLDRPPREVGPLPRR